jgi:hypothetical protein
MKVEVITHNDSFYFKKEVEETINKIESNGHTVIDIKFQYQWLSYGDHKYAAMIIYK